MPTSNDPSRTLAPRAGAHPSALRSAITGGVALLAVCLGAEACGGGDTASVRRDIRLDVSHQPPGTAPAGTPLLLGLRVTAEPPLAAGSAHLWYLADGGWERLALEPLTGTDRLEAEVPGQPKGRRLRYAFTVRTPLGDVLRLPATPGGGSDGTTPPGPRGPDTGAATAPDTTAGSGGVYELLVQAPVAPWAAWLRGAGSVLAAILVATGALLAFRGRSAESGARPRAFARLAAAGVLLFIVAALTGAVVVSVQATGNPVREVPGEWWIALAVWVPVLIVVSRAPSGREPLRAGPAWTLVLAGMAGAVLALAGSLKLL